MKIHSTCSATQHARSWSACEDDFVEVRRCLSACGNPSLSGSRTDFDLDRLARRYAYQVLLLDEFSRHGAATVFVHGPAGGPQRTSFLSKSRACSPSTNAQKSWSDADEESCIKPEKVRLIPCRGLPTDTCTYQRPKTSPLDMSRFRMKPRWYGRFLNGWFMNKLPLRKS